ncbi:MAG: Fe-S cluster assembly protein NifU [Acidobacteria bacterium]|nr:Fe-S cluster assembly protein NifU [Acidobacteriota bacterium]
MWEYSDKVREHFTNPRNVGEIEDATVSAEVGSLACGDALRLYLKLDDDGKITEAKFMTFGCGSAIASSSALTEMIIGKTIEEAEKITDQDIADYLGGLPEAKVHCSVMGREALEAAIAKLRGEPVPDSEEDEGKIVCNCFAITDKKIERVVREHNLSTVDEVTHYTKAGGGCGSCVLEIEDIIRKVRGDMEQEAKAEGKDIPSKRMTNLARIRKIEDVIDYQIRPSLQKDGGDIELIDVEGNTVYVALEGSCASCKLSDVTLSNFVQDKLREFVSPEIIVKEALY